MSPGEGIVARKKGIGMHYISLRTQVRRFFLLLGIAASIGFSQDILYPDMFPL